MAYARFGHDSDVYAYRDTRGGFTCERCPRVGEAFRCGTAAEMLDHLLAHRAKGDRVPDDALDELERDVEENIPNDADGSAT
jgi:transcriptional regulator of met regulon